MNGKYESLTDEELVMLLRLPPAICGQEERNVAISEGIARLIGRVK
jgi:hypothetical protein